MSQVCEENFCFPCYFISGVVQQSVFFLSPCFRRPVSAQDTDSFLPAGLVMIASSILGTVGIRSTAVLQCSLSTRMASVQTQWLQKQRGTHLLTAPDFGLFCHTALEIGLSRPKMRVTNSKTSLSFASKFAKMIGRCYWKICGYLREGERGACGCLFRISR